MRRSKIPSLLESSWNSLELWNSPGNGQFFTKFGVLGIHIDFCHWKFGHHLWMLSNSFFPVLINLHCGLLIKFSLWSFRGIKFLSNFGCGFWDIILRQIFSILRQLSNFKSPETASSGSKRVFLKNNFLRGCAVHSDQVSPKSDDLHKYRVYYWQLEYWFKAGILCTSKIFGTNTKSKSLPH